MSHPSRRAVLRYCGIGSVAAVAGCLSDDGDDNESQNGTENESDNESQNGTENESEPGAETDPAAFELAGDGAAQFREWVVPDAPVSSQSGVELVCQYNDYTAAGEGATGLQNTRGLIADRFDTDRENISGELIVGQPGDRQGAIVFGEFDADAVVTVFDEHKEQDITGEYQGYTVIEYAVAVGSEAVLETPDYWRHIDAHAGEGTRLGDSDPDAALLFDLLPAGPQTAVSRHADLSDLAINGETRLAFEDGAVTRSVRTLVFESADAATGERAREILSDGSGYTEILTTESHGRAVMVEYRP